MDFPLPRTQTSERFPWRTAAYVAGGVAAVELVLLVFAGGALVGRHEGSSATAAKPVKAAVAKHAAPAPAPARRAQAKPAARAQAKPKAAAGPVTHLARRRVEVLVLNGNGRTGAAGAAADRVRQKGYRIGGVANAKRHDYPQSIVLYRSGFAGEGQRLARDLGVRVVGPLDGMRKSDLHGAHVVYILGS